MVDISEELESCALNAMRDIRTIRHKQAMRMKKGRFMGTHPAMPWLDYIAGGGGGHESIEHATCYALSNLQSWSASKIYGIKSKLSGSELDAYEKKDDRIKECKKLFKDVCEKKITLK